MAHIDCSMLYGPRNEAARPTTTQQALCKYREAPSLQLFGRGTRPRALHTGASVFAANVCGRCARRAPSCATKSARVLGRRHGVYPVVALQCMVCGMPAKISRDRQRGLQRGISRHPLAFFGVTPFSSSRKETPQQLTQHAQG